jgi:hypothetical protein
MMTTTTTIMMMTMIMMIYCRGRTWIRFPVGARYLVFSIVSRPSLEPNQPPIQWVPRILSPGVKRLERETDCLLLSTAEVKNGEIYLHYPITLHGTVFNYIIKYRDNFTFTIYTRLYTRTQGRIFVTLYVVAYPFQFSWHF